MTRDEILDSLSADQLDGIVFKDVKDSDTTFYLEKVENGYILHYDGIKEGSKLNQNPWSNAETHAWLYSRHEVIFPPHLLNTNNYEIY